MRWLRGLGALVTLALVLVGAPVALAGWGRLPSGWSSLTRPDDGTLLLGVLTVVGWLAWAAFLASTALEAVRLLGARHRGVRLPLLGGLQQLSAGLLVAVLALAPHSPALEPAGRPVAAAVPEPEQLARTEPASPAGSYLVEAGDDLWTVADQLLGDGGRWRDLVAANPDRLQDPTARLDPGTRLALPVAGSRAPRRVTVERGDTLSGLALEHLGAGGRWPRIAAANPDRISDPDHIEIGWSIAIPGSRRVEPERARDDASADAAAPPANPEGPQAPPDSVDTGAPSAVPTEPLRRTPGTAASTADPSPTPAAAPPSAAATAEPSPTPAAAPPSAAATAEPSPTPAAAPPSAAATAEPSPTPAAASPSAAPPAAETTDQTTDAADADDRPALPLLGTLGTLAAAAIIGVVEARRFLRLRERPVGRRLVPPDDAAARLRTILGADQRPDRLAVLDASLRAIGRHCHDTGLPLPALARVVVGADAIAYEWVHPTGPPPAGFTGTRERWLVALAAPPSGHDHPCPYPAVVSLGSSADGGVVLVDAEQSRVLGVAAEQAELRRSTLAALAVELACAPWAAEARLVVTGADAGLVVLAGGDRAVGVADPAEAVARLRRLVAERRRALGAERLATLRVDPDRADAVAPVVFCLLDDVDPGLAAELDDVLAGEPVGVAVVLGAAESASAQWEVGGDVHAPSGRLAGSPGRLFAHAIPEATRAGVSGLLRAADDPGTTAAPWWGGPDSDNVLALPPRTRPGGDPVDIVRLVPATEHPQVLLLGPGDLRGANGPVPVRSRQQLVELCAWLLEHPGSTATEMAAGLAVAEGTRRSNLSRLRGWLGDAPDGTAYLPDAYSGRVLLHPGVTSDWHRLQLLLAPGVDRVGDSTLVAALELVRGAPLADAAPGQWHWAEELRIDVSCALRDVGLVLTDRALAAGDIDLARWAAARALVAAADDEQLLCARIRTEHRAGNLAEVERLVNQVTRQARILGVDLLPETVELCQQVVEGRLRARA